MSNFREDVLPLLGGIPHMGARGSYAELVQTDGKSISLRWEWIKRPDLLTDDRFDLYEGEEWVQISARQNDVVT